MKSYTRARVLKCCSIEVNHPRTIKSSFDFEALAQHLESLKTDSPILEDLDHPNNLNHTDTLEQHTDTLEQHTDTLEQEELEKARLEAENLLNKARLDAEKILQAARQEAKSVLEQARIEAEGYKDQLAESIRAEVTEQAYAAGFEKGHREGNQAAEDIIRQAEETLSLATKALHREFARAEDDLIRLAVKIAERVLRAELSVRPHKLHSVIKNLLSLPHERQGWRLHISYEDAAWLKGLEPEIGVPLLENDQMRQGDCMLECEDGLFDARLTSQLKVIEEALREEFRRGELEQPAAND